MFRRTNQDVADPANGQFQVLEVISTDEGVEARSISCDVEAPTEYHAISYAWGENWKATADILLDGKRVAVTPHLLRGLECVTAMKGCRYIWVDALCIDQKDDAEKSRQVAQMHRIFANANSVVVWLGEAEDESDRVMEYIARLDEVLPPLIQNPAISPASYSANKPWMVPLLEDRSLLEAVWKLSSRGWFERVWCLQEVVLASTFSCVCGMRIIDGSLMTRFALAMVHGNLQTFLGAYAGADRNEREARLSVGYASMLSIPQFRLIRKKAPAFREHQLTLPPSQRVNLPGQSNLMSVVATTRGRKAKEPLDRIYAILGLDDMDGAPYRTQLLVDYSKEAKAHFAQLYAEFGKVAIVTEPNFFLLSVVSSGSRPANLPSWCPNFNSTSVAPYLPSLYRAGHPAPDHYNVFSCYQGVSPNTGHPNFSHQTIHHVEAFAWSNDLRVRGAVIDIVAKLGPNYDLNEMPEHLDHSELLNLTRQALTWLDACWEFARLTGFDFHRDMFDPFWRTLVADLSATRLSFPAGVEQFEACLFFWQYLVLLIEQLEIHGTDDPATMSPQQRELMFSRPDAVELVHLFRVNLTMTWYRRTIFSTGNGRIGFASTDIRPQDLVCIFYTGPTIYILRKHPNSQKYTFICDGYVHSLMNGEAFELLDQGLAYEQEITIA